MTTLSEHDLIERLKHPKTREEAFRVLVRENQERLYRHIRRIVLVHEDADDVVQNTFIKIWKGLEGFRGESKLSTWMYRIATNEALSFLEKKKHELRISNEEAQDEMISRMKSDPWFHGDELQEAFQKAILSLPEKQRLVFTMRYFEDIRYEEMSSLLDTSVGALKASYHFAAKKIEKYIRNL